MPAVSLGDAAKTLESLCEQVDELDGDIGSYLIDEFNDAKEDLRSACDRRIRYIRYAEMAEEDAKKRAAKWTRRAKLMAASKEWVKKNTIQTIRENPGLVLAGEEGKFKIQRNSIASLRVDPETLDQDYFKPVLQVDKEKIMKALQDGVVVFGAKLECGEHLRIV